MSNTWVVSYWALLSGAAPPKAAGYLANNSFLNDHLNYQTDHFDRLYPSSGALFGHCLFKTQ